MEQKIGHGAGGIMVGAIGGHAHRAQNTLRGEIRVRGDEASLRRAVADDPGDHLDQLAQLPADRRAAHLAGTRAAGLGRANQGLEAADADERSRQ